MVWLLGTFVDAAHLLGHVLLCTERAELVDEPCDRCEQKRGGKEPLEPRTTDESDHGANSHDDEEAWTGTQNGSSAEKSDEREDDGCIRDTLTRRNLTLRSVVWHIWRHSMAFVHTGRGAAPNDRKLSAAPHGSGVAVILIRA